ncbi:major facilitator superfamily domain-containing protein [Fusarium redolens]|uniref:Major facilitator superfamily domain-containing protein n=1 Tax=Fusarium redolens TaxID=48865 RepID=A0A9P9KJV7_FUSRE|nr:major facilitator superfamily domain-containing protein [Fusarium redolens]KAH7259766.1 major facilitator superfamily domain-containing protein [Fusarium redolens]
MKHVEVDDQLVSAATPAPIPEEDFKKSERDLEEGSTSVEFDDPPPDDPNIVNWDGPDDPANPQNWSMKKKTINVILVSSVTFVTPLASSIFAPSIDQVMREFHSTNEQLASFIVSVYLLGYCFGPLVIAPLSEMYGRLPLYHICNVLFVAFTVACAKAPNLGGLIAFRLLAGLAGSCPLTIGAGSLADMISKEKRGAAMSSWALGPLFGPVIGPIAGGYLSAAKGWRWSFWVVAIVAGAITIVAFIFMRETYAYALLEKKAKKLRKETGNTKLRSILDNGTTTKEIFRLAITRPTKMLLFAPIVSLLSFYMALVYGYLYLLFTAMPTLFEGEYHFSSGSVGLSYIGIGVGSLTGLFISGASIDRFAQYLTNKNGGEAKPEYRLPFMGGACFIIPAGLFMFGWSAEHKDHWIVPIIGTAFLGCGMIIVFMCISVYLVDAYIQYAASAIAASTVLRSLVGALLPLAGRSMYKSLGYGWGTSLLGFIAAAAIPLPFIFYKYGERIRRKNLFDVKF